MNKNMRIIVDTREKPRAIVNILNTFNREGVEVVRRALPFGDYRSPDWDSSRHPGCRETVIDRKKDLNEMAKNFVSEHSRIVREIERANNAGCFLVFLIEHGGKIQKLEDVINWTNPRLRYSPYAVTGERLFKIMVTMQKKYGIGFVFCRKSETGKKIIELLDC